RLIFTIAVKLPRGNGPIWCSPTVRASTFISTTSGVREKGCSDGKTHLVNGPVRLREGQPAVGVTAAGTFTAAGRAPLYHARCQRRKREPYRPERAGVFYPCRTKPAGAELACQRLLLWRRYCD